MPMGLPKMDRTVVISLERQPERLRAFRASYAEAGWAPVLGEPSVFSAVDGAQEQVALPLSKQPQAFGCWASHVAVLRQALDDGVQWLAVFEDDALLQPSSGVWLMVVLAQLPPTAVGLWLDSRLKVPGTKLLPGTFGTSLMTAPPLRTHAYLLRRPAIEHLWATAVQAPGHIDHIYASAWLPDPVYAAVPSLAEQGGESAATLQSWRQEFYSRLQRSKPSRWLRATESRV